MLNRRRHQATYQSYSKSVIAVHVLTRFDSILTITGVGKATILKKLKLFSDLLDVVDTNTSIDEVVDSASLFVAPLFWKN